ncbi:MAG: SDR family oxidoreductase [Gammaproteobacteria bacterium]|nr:SDR family oxidoreductase [Gammaproteobacteria bacterium]MBT8443201.1 SDR family oxidoreductase [Gammaproteobacteria bacterium]NND35961.1 SDR family oxidoreductase [Gammaproteobacteria bacterium]
MANVIITGSSKGIGRGLAEEFVKRGHHVTISARGQASIDETVRELNDLGGGKANGKSCDVAKKDQVQALWDFGKAEFSSIDFWINNAGTATAQYLTQDVPEDVVNTLVDSNLKGTIFGSQVAITGFREQGSGALYNMLGGSFHGKQLTPKMNVYSSTKAAIFILTKYLIDENKDTGIMVGTISPGMLLSDNWFNEQKQMTAEQWQKMKPVLNILCDHVETAAPWLTDQVLQNEKYGHRIAWLSNGEIARRFFKAYVLRQKRDLFSRYELD